MADDPHIAFPARLDFQAAGALASQLSDTKPPIRIDASNTVYLGGQCLQALLSAVRTYGDNSLAIEHPTPEFLDGLRLMGVSPSTFGLSEA